MSLNLKPLPLLLALAGCGFTPLYGGTDNVAGKLDTVAVQNIPERSGQVLRLSLETQLHTAGAPTAELYSLNVSYTVAESAIGVLQDTATTRNRLTASASWSLAPIGNPGTPLASGNVTTETAENIIDQQYFALTLEDTTVNQELADQIAAQITDQVAAYFKTHPES